MTKTLTEQWREGKLPIGKYYIKTKWWGCDGKWHYEKEEDIDYLDGDWRFYQDDAVAEVLAPVPSYDTVKELETSVFISKKKDEVAEMVVGQLEKQLAIATNALEEYKEDYFISDGGGMSVNPNPDIARKALKDIKEVK